MHLTCTVINTLCRPFHLGPEFSGWLLSPTDIFLTNESEQLDIFLTNELEQLPRLGKEGIPCFVRTFPTARKCVCTI